MVTVADVIVVGAGSTGSVLAARLSDNVTGVRDSGTRIRVLWERRRGYEGYSTIHESSPFGRYQRQRQSSPGCPTASARHSRQEGGRWGLRLRN